MIRPLRVTLLLAFAVLQLSITALAADFPFEKQIIRNVVKISAYGGCGTGFVLDGGLLVTNAHVMQGACNQVECQGIKIYRSAGLGEKPELFKEIDFKIKANFPATDLVILESKENLGSQGLQGKVDVPLNNEKLFSYGFPHCENLEKFEGEVQELKKFGFESGFEGVRGQSGSPIFNLKGNIVGILNRSTEITFTGNSVELLASRIDRYISDLTKVGPEHIEVELLDQYEDFFSSISKAKSRLSMVRETTNHPFRESEVQFNLSGLCPELKDFFLWKSVEFRYRVAAPKIKTETLNPTCALIYKYAIKAGVFSEMMAAVNFDFLEAISVDQYSAIAPTETFKARDEWQKIESSKSWLSAKELQYLLRIIIGILLLSWLGFALFRKYKTPRKIFKYFLMGLISIALIQSFFI